MNSDLIYDIFTKVGQTRSMIQKQRILREAKDHEPHIRRLLLMCYHPHEHYNIRPTEQWIQGVGNDYINLETMDIMFRLVTGSLSGLRAKREVVKHLSSLTFKSAMLLIRIINKDMRMGMGVRTINQVYEDLIPIHAIQLAKPIDYRRIVYPVIASPKLDGLRAIYKNGKFYSRLGNEFQGLAKLEYEIAFWAKEFHKWSGVEAIFDGELMVEGEHFNEISGQLRSFKETDKAIFNMFDVPSMWDKPLVKRNNWLQSMDGRVNNTSQIQVVPSAVLNDAKEIETCYQEAIEEGYEGVMIKDPASKYENGRSYAWMKVKPTHSKDLKVVGTFEGQGKYEGICGGLVVSHEGTLVRVGSGLSDYQRRCWGDDSSDIVGATVEVAYQEVTPDGSLRHPRLKAVRGDK